MNRWARQAALIAVACLLTACTLPNERPVPPRSPSRITSVPTSAAASPAPSGVAPAPYGSSATVTFAAAGDFSESPAASEVLSAMGRDDLDLTVALGDLSYGDSDEVQQWCDFVTQRVGPEHAFQLLAGNHESDGQDGHIDDFAACLPNRLPGLVGSYGRQYYVDVPADQPLVRFVLISPGLDFGDGVESYEAGTQGYEWTARAIDEARERGISWVVAGMHTPCLSLGQYGCEAGEDLTNLLVDRRVDLVLTGHEHLYQRSRQLSHSGECARVSAGGHDPSCVADADSTLGKGAGPVFVTVGTGGKNLRHVGEHDEERDWFVTAQGSNITPTHGYLKVTATDRQLAAVFVGVDGPFTDAFTIEDAPAGG